MSDFLASELLIRVGIALLHSLWQGTIIAVLALAIMTIASRPSARYAIGCVALLLMLAALITTFVSLRERRSVALPLAMPTSSVTESIDAPAFVGVAFDTSLLPQPPKLPSTGVRVVEDVATREKRSWTTAAPWAASGWMAGIVLLTCRHTIGLFLLTNTRRRCVVIAEPSLLARMRTLTNRLGITRPIFFLNCSSIDCPAVFGWLRPTLLWPAAAMSGLTPTQLDAILAHELAHIRRHDYLVNLLQTLIDIVFFFHPAAWWLSRRVRQEREHCCDDIAAELVGDRVMYADALAALEQHRQSFAPAIGAHGGSLMKRIQRLMMKTNDHRVSGRALLLLLIGSTATWMTAIKVAAQFEPAAQPAVTHTDSPDASASDLTDVELKFSKQDDELADLVRAYHGHMIGIRLAAESGEPPHILRAARSEVLKQRERIAARAKLLAEGTVKPVEAGEFAGIPGGSYTLVGEDARSGVYSLSTRTTTITQAMISAAAIREITPERADTLSISIIRTVDGSGTRDRVSYRFDVPFAKIIAKQHEDFTVLPYDRIEVRTRETKQIASTPFDYRLAPNDLLHISILYLDAPDKKSVIVKRISETGKISLPYLDPLDLAGTTEIAAEAAIREAYKTAKVIPDAAVSVVAVERSDGRNIPVALLQHNAESATLPIGILRGPARPIPADLRTDAMLIEQLRNEANRLQIQEMVIHSKHGADSPLIKAKRDEFIAAINTIRERTIALTSRAQAIDPESTQEETGADLLANIEGRLKERLAQAEANPNEQPAMLAALRAALRQAQSERKQKLIEGEYYVSGKVTKPGVYKLMPSTITLSQALIFAGGVELGDDKASDLTVRIIRRAGNVGQNKRFSFPVSSILGGVHRDFTLEPNDHMQIVPTTRAVMPTSQPAHQP